MNTTEVEVRPSGTQRPGADLAHLCRPHRHDWECDVYPHECQTYCDGQRITEDALPTDQDCVVCEDMWAADPRKAHLHR